MFNRTSFLPGSFQNQSLVVAVLLIGSAVAVLGMQTQVYRNGNVVTTVTTQHHDNPVTYYKSTPGTVYTEQRVVSSGITSPQVYESASPIIYETTANNNNQLVHDTTGNPLLIQHVLKLHFWPHVFAL